MDLPPPLTSYLGGSMPSHAPRKNLSNYIPDVDEFLTKQGYLTAEGKPTKKALADGLLDTCEKRAIWNIKKVKEYYHKAKAPAPTKPAAPVRTEPAWVDLEIVGTYFAASKVKVGKWLDELGLREKPQLDRNSSGDYDMLDVARQKQAEQADGPQGKKPTEKAFQMGLARTITVIGKKQKEIEITQWNLDLCKQVLVKAGHKLDTDHTWSLKGKGKNSNVAVGGMDARAKELYIKWARLYSDPKTKWQAAKLFRGQPKAMLEKVEELMQMPGYLTEGRYLKE